MEGVAEGRIENEKSIEEDIADIEERTKSRDVMMHRRYAGKAAGLGKYFLSDCGALVVGLLFSF